MINGYVWHGLRIKYRSNPLPEIIWLLLEGLFNPPCFSPRPTKIILLICYFSVPFKSEGECFVIFQDLPTYITFPIWTFLNNVCSCKIYSVYA